MSFRFVGGVSSDGFPAGALGVTVGVVSPAAIYQSVVYEALLEYHCDSGFSCCCSSSRSYSDRHQDGVSKECLWKEDCGSHESGCESVEIVLDGGDECGFGCALNVSWMWTCCALILSSSWYLDECLV